VVITFHFVRTKLLSNEGFGIVCNAHSLDVERENWVIVNVAMGVDDFSVENVKVVLAMIRISPSDGLYSGVLEDFIVHNIRLILYNITRIDIS
jgi:hypothetical protein